MTDFDSYIIISHCLNKLFNIYISYHNGYNPLWYNNFAIFCLKNKLSNISNELIHPHYFLNIAYILPYHISSYYGYSIGEYEFKTKLFNIIKDLDKKILYDIINN